MIASARDDGHFIYVYDENGRTLFVKSGELMGFTGSTVTVRREPFYYTYDENGSLLYTK